jgi:hypothetical protein
VHREPHARRRVVDRDRQRAGVGIEAADTAARRVRGDVRQIHAVEVWRVFTSISAADG